MTLVPEIRIRKLNDAEIRSDQRYVLYWMVASRRLQWNYGLQHAVKLANQQQLPILILEALRCDYEWSSARMHQVFIHGMQDNEQSAVDRGLRYMAYLEPEPGAGKGLLEALAEDAAAVVTDEYPCLFVPKMQKAAANQLEQRWACPLYSVDSNGIVPLQMPEKTFARAFDFRRFFQKNALDCLADHPVADPLDSLHDTTRVQIRSEITERWAPADLSTFGSQKLNQFPYRESVDPVAEFRGGPSTAQKELSAFLRNRLSRYDEGRRDLDNCSTSGFSPYLRFGHLSSHQIVHDVLQSESWEPGKLKQKVTGSANGFWGTSEDAESFLDELITWREVGYNMSARNDDYDQYDSLPEWARTSLKEHQSDKRPSVYTLEEFEEARTHEELWNAAQRQLVEEGRIHNYMRMVWGKKILHWSKSPQEALEIMIHLNNKYAIDGRDPNSYSGIFWILGRYARIRNC